MIHCERVGIINQYKKGKIILSVLSPYFRPGQHFNFSEFQRFPKGKCAWGEEDEEGDGEGVMKSEEGGTKGRVERKS